MPLQVTFTSTQIADYLRIDPDQEQVTIETLKDAATDEAEEFLNTDFSVDGTPKEAPALVKEWILNRIAEKFENRGKPTKPDYSTLRKFRVYSFKAATNNNVTSTETPETSDIYNVTVIESGIDLLGVDAINGTTQNIIYNTDNTIQKIQHKDTSNIIVREDVFTYATNLITEVRTLSTGEKRTFVYHLDTGQTEVF